MGLEIQARLTSLNEVFKEALQGVNESTVWSGVKGSSKPLFCLISVAIHSITTTTSLLVKKPSSKGSRHIQFRELSFQAVLECVQTSL